jgi:4-amino-4-deoxy-L-arabinose transferase-like glycosyltransferase
MNKTPLYLCILTIFGLIIFASGLFQLPVTDRDEALFAQASKQMLESHNFGKIQVQNKARHLKPPGIYWLQALSAKTFGTAKHLSIGLFRIPSALGALLSIIILFLGMKRLMGETTAFIGSMLLAACILLIIEAHIATTDAMLLVTMIIMQLGLMQIYWQHREQKIKTLDPAVKPRDDNSLGCILFWFGMALGVLIKGITPLVGFATLFFLILIDKDTSLFKKIKPLFGILFLILFSLAWLIPFSIFGKSNFLLDMIHGDVVPKLIGGQQSHGAWPGYFLLLFPIMFWPGSLFIIKGIAHAWQNKTHTIRRFLIAWIIPSWIIFALIPTKLPQYVLPVYPAIALLIAAGIKQQLTNKWRYAECGMKIIWGIYSTVLLVFLCLLPRLLREPYSWIQVLCLIILLIIIIVGMLFYHRPRKILITFFIGTVLFYPLLFSFFLPQINNLWLSCKITNYIQSLPKNYITDKKPLLINKYHEPSLIFLLGTYKIKFVNDKNWLLKQIKQHTNNVIILDQLTYQEFTNQISLPIKKTIIGFNYNGGHWIKLHVIPGQNSH